MELESSSARESTTACLLEELSERVSSSATRETAGESSTGEGVSTLACHGIVRVVAIVEPLTKFWFAENLVGLVHGSHLGFAATLVGVSLHSCFPADQGILG